MIYNTDQYHAHSNSLQCVHVCMRVCVLDWAGSWVFASTALLVAWTAMYLTSYSDYLTCFHDPLLPPYLDLTLVGKMSSAITIPVSSGCSCAKERVKQQEKVEKGNKKGVQSLPIQLLDSHTA